MTAFDRMRAALFANDDIGIDAVHWPQGAAAGDTVRLVLASDAPQFGAGPARVVAERVIGEVRLAELDQVRAGDWFRAGVAGIWYKVEGTPERAADDVWRMGLRRSASPP